MKKKKYVISITIFLLFLFVFYRIIYYAKSDYGAHINFALQLQIIWNESMSSFQQQTQLLHIISYPMWHIIFCFLWYVCYQIFGVANYELVAAVECSAFVCGTIFLGSMLLKKYLNVNCQKYCLPFTVLLIFAGPLYIPLVNPVYYLGQAVITPWHNPTTIAVQPLAVLALAITLQLISDQSVISGKNIVFTKSQSEVKYNIIMYICLGMVLIASAFFKPSFYQMYVPGLFLYCCIDILVSRGKSFKFCVGLGLSVLPVCVLAIIQMITAFSTEGDGIGIGFLYVWKLFSPHPFGSIIISVAFPLYVLICNGRKILREGKLRLGLCCLISGAGQFALFYKKVGMEAGDFAWGFYLAVLILFFVTIIQFFEMYVEEGKSRKVILGAVLFFAQCVYGIMYLKHILISGEVFGGLF